MRFRNIPRKDQVYLSRLKMNHFPTLSYLHRVKLADDPTCPLCGKVEETIRHIIFECEELTFPLKWAGKMFWITPTMSGGPFHQCWMKERRDYMQRPCCRRHENSNSCIISWCFQTSVNVMILISFWNSGIDGMFLELMANQLGYSTEVIPDEQNWSEITWSSNNFRSNITYTMGQNLREFDFVF